MKKSALQQAMLTSECESSLVEQALLCLQHPSYSLFALHKLLTCKYSSGDWFRDAAWQKLSFLMTLNEMMMRYRAFSGLRGSINEIRNFPTRCNALR